MVILPASSSTDTDEVNRKRANALVVTARFQDYSVRAVKANGTEFFVLVRTNEAQAVGFARAHVQEEAAAASWFLFRRSTSDPLYLERADRSRELCTLTNDGFVLPDGHSVEIDTFYHPAQYNTALLHYRGYDVGEHL